MLGNIFRTTVFPLKSFAEMSVRSVFVSRKSGAVSPTMGKSPTVFTGSPLIVISAILASLIKDPSPKDPALI
jgi:hypothetical protein